MALPMVPFSFGGHDWLALPEARCTGPRRRALLVADLHFEKASFFARCRADAPALRYAGDARRPAALVTATGATEVWCLGDSFHDVGGCDRLPARARGATRR